MIKTAVQTLGVCTAVFYAKTVEKRIVFGYNGTRNEVIVWRSKNESAL